MKLAKDYTEKNTDMQRKTIIKTIKKELELWLDSITDPVLRDDVRKSLLVSGGCIASLYLQEKVNDYDIYIQDIEVAKRLAEYYVGNDTRMIVLSGSDKDTLVKSVEGKEDSAYVIAVKNLKEDQVKIFFAEKNGGYAPEYDEDTAPKYRPVFYSPNAISLSDDIQIVLRFTGDAAAIHKNFDFVHATSYFTYDEGLVTTVEVLESILSKTLKYRGSLYPVTSIIRIKKFIKRGWNISAGEMLKIMFQISELNLRDPYVLEEQLIGVDIAYFSKLIEILSSTKKETIDSHALNTIIDKVFNENDSDE
jgi:hypothetical protein